MHHRNHHLFVCNGFLTKYGLEKFMCKITKTIGNISKYYGLEEDSLDSQTNLSLSQSAFSVR